MAAAIPDGGGGDSGRGQDTGGGRDGEFGNSSMGSLGGAHDVEAVAATAFTRAVLSSPAKSSYQCTTGIGGVE